MIATSFLVPPIKVDTHWFHLLVLIRYVLLLASVLMNKSVFVLIVSQSFGRIFKIFEADNLLCSTFPSILSMNMSRPQKLGQLNIKLATLLRTNPYNS